MPYIGNTPESGIDVRDRFAGNGVLLNFTLSRRPSGAGGLLVIVSGVVQDSLTYGFVDKTLTFTEAPPAPYIGVATNVEVVYLKASSGPQTANWNIPIGNNSGTSDVIAVTYSPAIVALTDNLVVKVVMGTGVTNATTTPTFSPSGLTIHTITGFDGTPLTVGQLAGTFELRYNLATTSWGVSSQSRVAEPGANTSITSLGSLASVNRGQLAGMRNRIINGDMRIAQRGASGGVGFSLDRWLISSVGTAVTWAQSVATPSTAIVYVNDLQINGAVGNTAWSIIQRIESLNCRDLANNTSAISFWCYQTSGSAMAVYADLSYANVTDNFSGLTGIGGSSQIVPNATWTYVTLTQAIPNLASTGLQLTIGNHGALTSGVFAITNVQLELGSTATSFEQRPIGLELSLCQRYLPSVSLQGYSYTGQAYSAAGAFVTIPFPQCRIAPTGVSSTAGLSMSLTNLSSAGGTLVFNSASTTSVSLTTSAASGMVAGNASMLQGVATLLLTGVEL